MTDEEFAKDQGQLNIMLDLISQVNTMAESRSQVFAKRIDYHLINLHQMVLSEMKQMQHRQGKNGI